MTPATTARRRRDAAPDVLARRAQLEDQELNLRERLASIDAEERQAADELARLRSEIAGAEVESARHGQAADVEQLQARVTALTAGQTDRAQAKRAIAAAADAIPNQIAELHRAELDAFAAVADEQARDAEQALRALEHAYRDAYDRWQQAAGAWQRMLTDLDYREYNRSAPAVAHSKRALTHVLPDWPLPAPSEIFDADLPRPAPVGYLAPSERGEPKPGTYRDVLTGTLQHLDKSAIRAHRHLLDPDPFGFAMWRRVDDE